MNIGIPLEKYVNGAIYRGIVTGYNDAFVIDEKTKQQLMQEDPKSADVIKPYLIGRDVHRYGTLNCDKYLLYIPWHFPLHMDNTLNKASKKAESEFKIQYPAIYNHLLKFKTQLESRNITETGIRYEWYALQRYGSKYFTEFEKVKLIYLVFQVKPAFTFDTEGKFYLNNAIWMIPNKDLILLGILNSKLGWFLISHYCTQIQNGYQLIFQYLSKLPIRTINFSDPADKARHDRMVTLVTQMLDLNKKMQDARLDQDKTLLSRQIEATDAAIDTLVYELYGLTPEEIAIVEGCGK
jgi:hypothetical protein